MLPGQSCAGQTAASSQVSSSALREDAGRLLEQAQHIRRQLFRARAKVEDAKASAQDRSCKILQLAQETDGLIESSLASNNRELRDQKEGCVDAEKEAEDAFEEPELRALAAHAEEAERREREAVEEVESLRQALERTGLRRPEAKSNQPLAAVLDAVAGGLPLQEQMCYEWLRMLRHDKPAHSALMIVEAECDVWEDRLHSLLAPEACKPGFRRQQGLDRLQAELSDLTSEERMRKTSCSTCLQLLSQKAEQHAWRDLEVVYALVDDLRCANDMLAGEKAKEQWQQLAAVAKEPKEHQGLPHPHGSVEAGLPPGPKFFSVAQLLQSQSQDTAPAEPDDLPRMPPAVLSPAEWATSSPCQASHGLSFLYGPTSQARLQPVKARATSLEQGRRAQYCFEPSIFSAAGDSIEHARSVDTMQQSTELLRQVFEEPLSEAIGTRRPTSSSSSLAGHKVPPSLADRPSRAGWVTFEARGAVRHPLPEEEAVQNDIISRGSPQQDEHPSQWDFAWPDSVLQPPSEPMSDGHHSRIPAFSTAFS